MNLEDYKVGHRYYFYPFTSTSLSQDKAKSFAKRGGVIFKIIVGINKPMHNLRLYQIGSVF